MLGGTLFLMAAAATVLIYFVFAEAAKGTFFGQHSFIHMLDVPTFALLAMGAVGVYTRQKDRLGKAGKAGFLLAFAGFGLAFVASIAVVVVGLTVGDEATLGVLDALAHPLPMLLYTIGSLLFGIATYRAGMLPRPAAAMVAVGPGLLFATFSAGLKTWEPLVPMFMIGLGWAWLGHALLSERKKGVPESQPAAA